MAGLVSIDVCRVIHSFRPNTGCFDLLGIPLGVPHCDFASPKSSDLQLRHWYSYEWRFNQCYLIGNYAEPNTAESLLRCSVMIAPDQ